MKKMGYGADYKYSHNYPGHFVRQQFMPDSLGHPTLWHPADNLAEQRSAALQYERWHDSSKNNEGGLHQSAFWRMKTVVFGNLVF